MMSPGERLGCFSTAVRPLNNMMHLLALALGLTSGFAFVAPQHTVVKASKISASPQEVYSAAEACLEEECSVGARRRLRKNVNLLE